jgi:hypothetical protein
MFDRPTAEAELAARNKLTLAKVYETRLGAIENAITTAAQRIIDEYGTDPRNWPDIALDRIAKLEGRRVAIEYVATAARRSRMEWANTPAKEQP